MHHVMLCILFDQRVGKKIVTLNQIVCGGVLTSTPAVLHRP